MNDLYCKNGKAKKKYCMCMSKEYWAELRRVNGYVNGLQCAGLRCSYYAIGCGRNNIEKHESQKRYNDKNPKNRRYEKCAKEK